MAYRFEPAKSYYVDPRSTEVSQILNDRFTQNFATADALSTAMRDMQYAPFENDTQLAKDLQKSTAENLQQMAAKGDYENMTFNVANSAKKFKDQYAPIEKNYQLVSKYQTEIEDLYKAGKIDAETMNNAFKYSTHNYKGVKIDPNTGYADPNSYFRGTDVVQDPNILEMVTKGIADMMADGNTSKVKRTGQGANAQYEVLTENGWEGVSADRVKTIINTVMNQPNVQAFLEQEGRFKTYAATPEQLKGWAGSLIQQYQNNIAQIQKGNYKPAEKTQAINSLNAEIANLQQNLQNPEVLREYAKQNHINTRIKEFEDYGVAKKAYSKTTSSYIQDWDAKYLKEFEQNLKNLPEVVVAGEAHEIPNTAGNSAASIKTSIEQYNSEMQALQEKINSGVYSIEEVDNMERQVADYQTKINAAQTRLNNALKATGADFSKVTQNLEEAKNEAYNYMNKLKDWNSITFGKQLSNENDKTDSFLFPWEYTDVNISTKNVLNEFINNNFDIDQTIESLKKIVENNTNGTVRFKDQDIREAKDFLKYYRSQNPKLQEIKQDMKKADELLQTTQKPIVTFTNVMPGFDASQRAANTKAINDFFKAGIPNHLHAFTSSGGLDQGLTSMQSLIDKGIDKGGIGSDYKVVGQVLINEQSSNVGSGIGDDLYAVTVEYTGAGDKPVKKTLYIPVNEANIASQSAVLNHPTNRWNKVVATAKSTAFNSGDEYVQKASANINGTNYPLEYHIDPIGNTVKVKYNGQWVSNENGPIKYGVGDSEFLNNFVNKSVIKF